ncbi:hypothetical protein NMG60_11011881 [Bertholletia excelsa]
MVAEKEKTDRQEWCQKEEGEENGRRGFAALTGTGGDIRNSASSDAGDQSRHSPSGSSAGAAEIVCVSDKRESSASECSVVVDLEAEVPQIKAHLSKSERNCRICHLSLDAANPESGTPVELGCSCKDDLAAAHKQCAEAWFKIRGNRICEICGSTACNIAGSNDAELMGHWNEANEFVAATAVAPVPLSETRRFWQDHRFLNFMLAFLIFAFMISWLFHFNVST